MLGGSIREAQGWVSGCPCHEHLLKGAHGHAVGLRRVAKELSGPGRMASGHAAFCPMKGRRAPELVNGSLAQLLESTLGFHLAEVIAMVRLRLTDAQATVVITDMEHGKSHVLGTLELKLKHWSQPPWKLCGLAHHDPHVVKKIAAELRDLMAKGMSLVGQHQLTLDFLVPGGVRGHVVQRLADGRELGNDADREAVAAFKFIDLTEQSVERDHADLNMAAGKRRPGLACALIVLLKRC